jgi:hypothetical protein
MPSRIAIEQEADSIGQESGANDQVKIERLGSLMREIIIAGSAGFGSWAASAPFMALSSVGHHLVMQHYLARFGAWISASRAASLIRADFSSRPCW